MLFTRFVLDPLAGKIVQLETTYAATAEVF
jgi:hypothetical protein